MLTEPAVVGGPYTIGGPTTGTKLISEALSTAKKADKNAKKADKGRSRSVIFPARA